MAFHKYQPSDDDLTNSYSFLDKKPSGINTHTKKEIGFKFTITDLSNFYKR